MTADGGTDAYGESPYSSTAMDGVAVTASAVEKSGGARSSYFGVGCDPGNSSPQYEFVVDVAGDYYIAIAGSSIFDIVSAGHVANMRAAGAADEIEGSCTRGTMTDGTLAVALRMSVNGVAVASVFDTAPPPEAPWGGGVVVTSSESADPVLSALFTSFSMTDLAMPATLGTNAVVYADSMGNPATAWDDHRWDKTDATEYGSGGYDISADGWVETSSPYAAPNLTSIDVAATAKEIGGAVETLSGVFCTNGITANPQYIFFASPNGTWEIDGLPNVKRAPVPLLKGHFATPRGAARTVIVMGRCTPVSSGGGRYTTQLAITVDGKQVGSTKAVATGTQHPWTGGIMIVTFQGDPASTVSFTNFSVVQLAP